jgi:transposase
MGGWAGVPANAIKLLPVSVVEDKEPLRPEPVEPPHSSPCAIHIELPGEIRISLEGSVDQDLVHTVLKSLRA